MMRAVRKHAREKWVVLYIERWLKAPAQDERGHLTPRDKGTPQGGVISPLLANGKYYRSMLYPVLRPLDRILVRWACRKYKKLRGHHRRAAQWLRRIAQRDRKLWVHWEIGVREMVA